MRERVDFLGAEFDPITRQELIDAVVQMIHAGERGYLCTINVAVLMQMQSDEGLQHFVRGARFVVADGQPLLWAARLLGARLPERITGIDLVEALSDRAQAEGLAVYLLGARPDVSGTVASRLTSRFPRLAVRGHSDGYFGAEEEPGRVQAIAGSGAQVLFVAMGVPKQEFFIDRNWARLGVAFAVGVGGSFDVLSGRLRRAPQILQKTGLEWAYRLAQEPRRLWRRYLVTNSRFIWLVLKQLLRRGRSRLRPAR